MTVSLDILQTVINCTGQPHMDRMEEHNESIYHPDTEGLLTEGPDCLINLFQTFSQSVVVARGASLPFYMFFHVNTREAFGSRYH